MLGRDINDTGHLKYHVTKPMSRTNKKYNKNAREETHTLLSYFDSNEICTLAWPCGVKYSFPRTYVLRITIARSLRFRFIHLIKFTLINAVAMINAFEGMKLHRLTVTKNSTFWVIVHIKNTPNTAMEHSHGSEGVWFMCKKCVITSA